MKKTEKKTYASPEMDIQYFALQDIISAGSKSPLGEAGIGEDDLVDDSDNW